MTTAEREEPAGLEATLRAMARAEAQALDGAAFMARLQQEMARNALDLVAAGSATDPSGPRTASVEPAGAFSAPTPWLALPVGLALALMAWLALGFMDTSAGQWSTAIAQLPQDKTPSAVTTMTLSEAVLRQVAGLVLCAWCAWTTWQLRRWT